MSTDTRDIIGKAVLETLEQRRMLSASSLVNGLLVVQGAADNTNQITINTDGQDLWAVTNGQAGTHVAISEVREIRIIGGEADDKVKVDAAVRIPVYIQTGNGNDTIQAGSGNDTIVAGNGDDRIASGAGKDVIEAGNGGDTVYAGSGDDRIDGGNGSDFIDDGKGDDRITADSGDDHEHSGAGQDTINLGIGKDHADGVGDNDSVHKDSHDVVAMAPALGHGAPHPHVGHTRPPVTDDNNSNSSVGSGIEGELPVISSFTLINADTDQPIAGYENMAGNVSIDLASLPTTHLNIRANFDNGSAGSVVYGYDDDARFSIENYAPYALNGDLDGNYAPWTPTVGAHTIKATAYDQAGGHGNAENTATLRLNVRQSISDPAPTPDPVQDPNPTTDPTPTPDPIPDPTPTHDGSAPAGVITIMDSNFAVDHAVQVNGIDSDVKAGSLLTADFIWDFGDSGSKFNRLKGWNAAHLYTQPGTYTIKLTITNEDGQTSVTERTINVAAANRKVIYVSNDGSDGNSGLSPTDALKSFGKAMSMLDDNTEILFHRGDTFDVPKGGVINGKNVVIGAYGTGVKPVLNYTGARNYSSFFQTTGKSQDVTIADVTFDSVYSHNHEKTGMPDAVQAGGTNIAIYNVTFLNIGYGVNTNLKPTGLLMQECDAPSVVGVRSYLAYCQGSDQVFLGNTVANVTREHVLRVDGTDRILIAYNNFTNQDRRSTGDNLDIAKQTITVHHGSYAYIYGNVTHDGRVEVGPLGEADGLKPTNIIHRLNWVRVEGNDFHFNEQNRLEIDHGTAHVMICDNKIDVVSGSGIVIQAAGMYTNWPAYGTRHVEDVIVADDNIVTGTNHDVSVGKGSVGIQLHDQSYVHNSAGQFPAIAAANDPSMSILQLIESGFRAAA